MDAFIQPLAERLDLITLISMAFVSKANKGAVAAELRERLKRGVFFVLPLVDGDIRTLELERDYRADDSETESVNDYGDDECDLGDDEAMFSVTRYDRCAPITLTWKDGMLRVPDGEDGTFQWHGQGMMLYSRRPDRIDAEDYCGQKLRVYWTPAPEDGVDVVQWYGSRGPRGRTGIKFAEIRIEKEWPALGEHVGYDPDYGNVARRNSLRYEIMEESDDESDSSDSEKDKPVTARIVSFQVKARQLVWCAAVQEWSSLALASRTTYTDYISFLMRWARV